MGNVNAHSRSECLLRYGAEPPPPDLRSPNMTFRWRNATPRPTRRSNALSLCLPCRCWPGPAVSPWWIETHDINGLAAARPLLSRWRERVGGPNRNRGKRNDADG
jgi:hypothetical protein